MTSSPAERRAFAAPAHVSSVRKPLWMQVAHVDPLAPNPSVSEFTRRESKRLSQKRGDGKRYWDP